MFMLPDITQWSTVGNYGYIRHDVYLAPPNLKEIDLIHVRLNPEHKLIQTTGHIPSLRLWVEFSEFCPSRMS